MERKLSTQTGRPILTAEITRNIIECLKPSIAKLLEMHDKKCLHVMVFNTNVSDEPLFDGPVAGDPKDYPNPIDMVALAKANLCNRTGISTWTAITSAAHLMMEGDVIYQGGICFDGLIIVASGAPAPLDEAISLMIGVNLSAWCQIRMEHIRTEVRKSGGYLIPEQKVAESAVQ